MKEQYFESTICKLVWAYAGKVPAAAISGCYMLSNHFAWLLINGRGELNFESGHRQVLKPGYWYLPSPHRLIWQSFSPDSQIISIRFRLETPDGASPLIINDCLMFSENRSLAITREAKRVITLTKGFMDGPKRDNQKKIIDLEHEMALQASFFRWMQLLLNTIKSLGVEFRIFGNVDSRICKMLEILRKTVKQGTVPYHELGAASSLGRVQIDRLFREALGISPKQAMKKFLAEQCKDAVSTCDLSIKELARNFGFSSTPQFCAWFKKQTGLPPSLFRKKFSTQ